MLSVRRWQLLAIGALTACFLSVLLAHAYIGSFSRVMADTYCYAGDVAAYGFLGAQRFWYISWTGRYSFNLTESLAGWAGPRLSPVWPSMALAVWLAVLIVMLEQLRLADSRPARWRAALLLGTLILSVTLSNIPLVTQSLYWSDGLSDYVPPLVLATALAGLLIYAGTQPTRSRLAESGLLAGAAILPAVAGGFSEIYEAMQVSALLALVLAVVLFGSPAARRRWLPLSVASLLGAGLALAVVIVAPGNKVREASFPPHLPVVALVTLALQLTWGFLQTALLKHSLNLAAAVLVPAVLAAGWLDDAQSHRFSTSDLIRAVLWAPLVTAGLLVSGYAVAAYGMAAAPPARAQIIFQYAMILGLVVFGYALGGLMRRAALGQMLGREVWWWRTVIAGLIIAMGLSALWTASQTLSTEPVFAAYAQAWDQTDQLLRQARAQGLARVSVPPLDNPYGLAEAVADPANWVNTCISQYYHLSVAANPPLPAPSPAELQRSTPLDGTIGDVAQVIGYRLDQESVRAGQTLTVTVYWKPQAATNQPYTVFVHLYDPSQGSLAQVDEYPGQGKYPTTSWVYDHVFADTYALKIPAQIKGSPQAEIVLGLYDLKTLQRLPVIGQDAQPDQSWIRFGAVQVIP